MTAGELAEEIGDPRHAESLVDHRVTEVYVRDEPGITALELVDDLGVLYRIVPFTELDSSGAIVRHGLTVSRKWPRYDC